MEKRKRCAVKSRCLSAGIVPYGNWFAPPGSNRSSGLGNEAVGAFGVKDRISDSASMQVVMRMNVEEASKTSMQVLTRPPCRGRLITMEEMSEQFSSYLPG